MTASPSFSDFDETTIFIDKCLGAVRRAASPNDETRVRPSWFPVPECYRPRVERADSIVPAPAMARLPKATQRSEPPRPVISPRHRVVRLDQAEVLAAAAEEKAPSTRWTVYLCAFIASLTASAALVVSPVATSPGVHRALHEVKTELVRAVVGP